MASGTTQRLGGVLMTDQRSASEAVMMMWLAAGDDSALATVLDRHVIVGVLHIIKGTSGLDFDTDSVPVLKAPGGITMARLEGPDLTPEIEVVLERLKSRLKSREAAGGAAILGALADRFAFFIFEVGDQMVGQGWTADYAGRVYPVKTA